MLIFLRELLRDKDMSQVKLVADDDQKIDPIIASVLSDKPAPEEIFADYNAINHQTYV